ncbi:MAG: hypothetical protein KBD07_02580 [Candidatus Omnitrophica bacterium]|jgi:predicted  nucleic acid-binding Zn-ribbon protein|nr:hypothetical protein [Candidatus Omnitrophota bacterium]
MAHTLTDQIKVLVDLQKIDAKIYEIRRSLDAFPARKKTIETQLAAAKARFAAAEENTKKLQVRQKELENDALAKENQAKKYLQQQSAVKTNQEYSALTKEIQNANADRSIIEDQILKLMEEVEAQKKSIADEKGILAESETKVKQELETITRETASINAQIEALNAERKQYLPGVDAEVLAQYGRILAKRDGVALAVLQGESCGGCGLSFPPQTVNEIKMKESMIFCESCSRIIYEA